MQNAKGAINDANVKEEFLIGNYLLKILFLDFTTVAHSKDGKENIYVMIDNFSNFTVAVGNT